MEDMGGTSDTAGQTHLEGCPGANRLRFPNRKFSDGAGFGYLRVCDDLDRAQDQRPDDFCRRFFSLSNTQFRTGASVVVVVAGQPCSGADYGNPAVVDPRASWK